jgi:ankyrin repeat protein
MENWSNLNIYLTRANEDSKKQEALSKELIDACIKNDKLSIKRVLKMGAPINCNDEHITPLIACMQNDNSDLASYLIKAGARISYKPIANFEDAFWYALKNKKHNFLLVADAY